MEELQNAKYREIMSLRLYYDWHTLVFAPFIVIKIITCCLQGSTHGRSSENDAVPVEGGANHQEAGQVRVFTKVSHACFDPLGSDNMILCRNLGTIKDRKREKRRDKKADNAAEPILKVLRMRFVVTTVVNVVLSGFCRPNTQDFLTQQLKIMSQIQAEQQSRKEQRQSFDPHGNGLSIPPVPLK
jgi:hypothetical protein